MPRPPLQALALVQLSTMLGCAVIQDIGNAVDDAADSVVGAAKNVVGPRKAPPLIEPPAVETEDEAFKLAQAHYEEGKTAYQLAKYIDAVAKFEASFAEAANIEDVDVRTQIQSTLFFNLGQAQRHAYDLDRDPGRLAQARDLLRNHLNASPHLSDEERAFTENTIAEIEAQIEAHDAGEDAATAPDGGDDGNVPEAETR